MIVLDASAAASLLLIVPSSDRLRERIASEGETLHAPHLLDLEVLNVLRRHVLRGSLSEERAQEKLAELTDLRITLYPHRQLRPRIWELRKNITPYDAVYVALSETLAAPLVTTDSGLAGAPGLRAKVELFD